MQSGPGCGEDRDIAVGPSRASAARVFGLMFDDAHVTSYEDFRTEVEPGPIRSVALVGGVEASGLLVDLAADAPPPERILIGFEADLTGRDEVVAALATSPRLRPFELAAGADGTVVVRLASADQVAPADAERVLGQLRALVPAPPNPGVPVEHSARPTLRRLVLVGMLAVTFLVVLVVVLLL